MFGSSQLRNEPESTFVFKQVEGDVGLSGSAKALLQEIKKEWRILHFMNGMFH